MNDPIRGLRYHFDHTLYACECIIQNLGDPHTALTFSPFDFTLQTILKENDATLSPFTLCALSLCTICNIQGDGQKP
jgi:hypothetical protein